MVDSAANGDQAAWNALVAQFAGLVWSITRSYRLGPADAADVSQTAWLRLVEHLGRLNEPDRVGSWLAATTRHECLAVLRRSGRQLPTEDEYLEPDPGREPTVDLDAELIRDERRRALWQGLGQLSAPCQRLLRLLMTDPPPSYDDVAAALDMPVGSIGPTRGRCLERLRQRMQISGIHEGSGDSTT